MADEPDKKGTASTTKAGEKSIDSQKTSVQSNGGKQPAAIVLLLITTLSVGFLGGWLGAGSRENSAVSQTKQTVLNESQLISNLAEEVGPSVVSVDVVGQSIPDDIFGFSRPRVSAGTGFIIDSEGIIITNRHVVPTGTTNVSVTLADGTELENVEVIGRTSESDPLDVAFLKVTDKKGKTLKPIKLGDSSKMEVGDKVIAIGNALGQFQNTVTEGIISGYGRNVVARGELGGDVETLEDLFQTDAAINEGNSGGPLVNADGEVIGINTAVAGNAQNIGFAIPINDVKGLISSVLKEGKLLRPYLGVRYISLTDDVASQLELDTKRGAYITPGSTNQPSILPDSPAEKAGLQEEDIITKVNDTSINENNSLTSVLGRHSVGDTVTLTVVRKGETVTVQATLAAAPTS